VKSLPLHLSKNIFIKRNDVKGVDFNPFHVPFKSKVLQSISSHQRKNKEREDTFTLLYSCHPPLLCQLKTE